MILPCTLLSATLPAIFYPLASPPSSSSSLSYARCQVNCGKTFWQNGLKIITLGYFHFQRALEVLKLSDPRGMQFNGELSGLFHFVLFFVFLGNGWGGNTVDCAYLVFIQTLLSFFIRTGLILSNYKILQLSKNHLLSSQSIKLISK